MATVIKNLLSFNALAPAATLQIPHGLNFDGISVGPDRIEFDVGDIAYVSSTDTTVTIRNDGAAPATGRVYVEHFHTFERAVPPGTDPFSTPFVPAGGGGGGGTDPTAIHVDVAGEIAGIALKAAPVDADLLVIEDSEDVNNKKSINVGTILPARTGVQFAALIENPGGTPVFQRLTEDMILPAFVVTLSLDGTNTFEVGNDIVDPTFTVAYANGVPAAATIDDGVTFVPLIAPYTSGQINQTYSSDPGAAGNNQTQVFNVDATSTEGANKQDSDTATWLPRVFFGGVADPGGGGYTEAFIEGLGASALASSRNRTIAYNTGVGEFMFYAFPTDYGGGTPTFKDQQTGFDAGFSQVATGVSVTNAFGNTQDYEVWRSDNSDLGAVNIVVT